MNTPAFGSRTPLSTPVLQARDLIYEALLLAVGEVLTEERARERANNAATALLPLLEERGRVVKGEIETMDEHARRVIK